jgi:cytoskeletal protein CcmA (bactofilin family)
LRIRGQVKGTVAIDQGLTIENGSFVEADALATDILVAGSIQGNLRARGTLALRSTGRVEGSLQASRMRVEEGAILKGTVLRGGSSS